MLSTDLEVFRMYCHNVGKINADDILCSEDDNDSTTKRTDDIIQYKWRCILNSHYAFKNRSVRICEMMYALHVCGGCMSG